MHFSMGQEVWIMNLTLVIHEFSCSFKRMNNNIKDGNCMFGNTNDITTYYNITNFILQHGGNNVAALNELVDLDLYSWTKFVLSTLLDLTLILYTKAMSFKSFDHIVASSICSRLLN